MIGQQPNLALPYYPSRMPPTLRRAVGCALSLLMVFAGVTVAFPQDPNDVDIELYYDGTWNNINQYVYHRDMAPIVITRGRTAEGRNCDPGKMTLTLNNRDGRFSPRNPNSPLWGKIGRNTPIRVKVTYDAVTYLRFVGEITSWPSRWDVSQKDIWVPIEAAGILRRLGMGSAPLRAALYRAISADSPVAFWALEDGLDATQAGSALSGGFPMLPSGTVSFAAAAGPNGGVGPLADLSAGRLQGVVAGTTTTGWAFELIAEVTESADDGLIASVRAADALEFDLYTQTTLAPVAFGFGGGLNSAAARDAGFTDTWHHFLVKVVQDGADLDAELWYDGELVATGGLPGQTVPAPVLMRINSPLGANDPLDMRAGFAAVHLTADIDAVERYQAMLGWSGDEAQDRFSRTCTQVGVPFAVIGSDGALMGPERTVTLLQALRDCEAADQGFLFETRDSLGLQFRTNRSRYNQMAIALDYDVGHISPPFDPEPDDRNVANDREVKRRNGSSARRELTSGPLSVQDPPDGVGRYDDSITVDAYSDDQLEHIASWRLHVGTWDAERYPRVRVDLSAAQGGNAALIPQIAAADSGDLITIDNLPAWLPPETAELLIEGYREVIGFYDWDFIFNTSPAGPYNVVGVWGLVGKELHAAINTSVTSADIATTSGPLLATTLTGGGYTAKINNEEVQVTAVAASTVTFGAAGTVTHANNASVTPGIPASVATGNLLLVFAAIRNSGTGVPDTPAGYTRLAVFGSTDNCQLFAKIATSGAEAAPTITFTGGVANADTSAQMIRLAGKWHSTSNILLDSNTQLNASAQNINYPGLMVPLANDCIILYLGWKQDDWTSVTSPGTEIGEPDTTTGDDQGIVWAYTIQTTAAAISRGSFTVTGGATAISRSAVAALRCDYQTATITRSVNSVSASHSAADAVTLARPSRWAL